MKRRIGTWKKLHHGEKLCKNEEEVILAEGEVPDLVHRLKSLHLPVSWCKMMNPVDMKLPNGALHLTKAKMMEETKSDREF